VSGCWKGLFDHAVNEIVMSDKKNLHAKWLHIRLTEEDYDRIHKKFEQSTDRKFIEYARKVLLNKPITVNQRNQSLDDFMAEMIALRNELNAIGNNYNQTVKRLHALQQIDEIKTWLILNETARQIILGKIAEIKSKINQIDSQWLQ
jgi:predicted GNAT family acetyltransferase